MNKMSTPSSLSHSPTCKEIPHKVRLSHLPRFKTVHPILVGHRQPFQDYHRCLRLLELLDLIGKLSLLNSLILYTFHPYSLLIEKFHISSPLLYNIKSFLFNSAYKSIMLNMFFKLYSPLTHENHRSCPTCSFCHWRNWGAGKELKMLKEV